jgi:hypothetical protein
MAGCFLGTVTVRALPGPASNPRELHVTVAHHGLVETTEVMCELSLVRDRGGKRETVIELKEERQCPGGQGLCCTFCYAEGRAFSPEDIQAFDDRVKPGVATECRWPLPAEVPAGEYRVVMKRRESSPVESPVFILPAP